LKFEREDEEEEEEEDRKGRRRRRALKVFISASLKKTGGIIRMRASFFFPSFFLFHLNCVEWMIN
jgi:hypothetical protein